MVKNAVDESLEFPIEDKSSQNMPAGNESFPRAIEALGEALFLKYDNKTSNLTPKNVKGMIKIEALNDFMQAQYGFRYTELDTIVLFKKQLVVSQKGFGIDKLIEALKAIQASFTQTELPASMIQNILRRG